MKIAAFVHFYIPEHNAGSEIMLHSMLKPLAAAGHEVSVIVTQEGVSRKRTIDSISVYRPDNPVAKLAELAPDLIVTHHDEMRRAYFSANALGAKFATILHNDFMNPMWAAAQMRPDILVFNTNWVRASFARQFGNPQQALVVHPPVDGSAHRTEPGSKVTLVNLNRDKGAEVFYQLARELPEQQFLGVVGGHGEQLIDDSLPNVEIMPHTSDMRSVWKQTRTLLMPSIYESYGLVSIEAAHSGIPTIAHPTPGLQEALGPAGTFIDRSHVDAWAQAITVLDGEAWEAKSAEARSRAQSLDPTPELASWVAAVEDLEEQ